MQPITNWQNVKPVGGESRSLPAGGYVCKIVDAKEEVSRNGNPMLVVAVDIAEGEYAGFFREKYQNSNPVKWPNAAIIRINEPTANDDQDGYQKKAGRIKKFIQDVEESNDPYVFKWDEKTLRGKCVGGLFGREEFESNQGGTAWSTKIFFTTTKDKIATGSFSVPKDRPLDNQRNYQPTGYYQPQPGPAEEFVPMPPAEMTFGEQEDLPF